MYTLSKNAILINTNQWIIPVVSIVYILISTYDRVRLIMYTLIGTRAERHGEIRLNAMCTVGNAHPDLIMWPSLRFSILNYTVYVKL